LARGGRFSGARASRALIVVIRFSFQILRWSCQTPNPIRIATPAMARSVASSTLPFRSRGALLTSRSDLQAGPQPPYDDIAAQSARLCSDARERASRPELMATTGLHAPSTAGDKRPR